MRKVLVHKKFGHKNLRTGDVFTIALTGDEYLLGQILEPGREFYMCVFSKVFYELTSAANAVGLPLLLIGLTTDALFFHGRWKVIGSAKLPATYPRPLSVVEGPHGLDLVDFDQKRIRAANSVDEKYYGFRTSFAPVIFENAARAFLGIETDAEDLSDIMASDAVRRAVQLPELQE